MICIVDYNTGNISSISNMLSKIGIKNIISKEKHDILYADKLILPGVGSFDNGIKNLEELDLIRSIEYKVIEKKTPILGICLGAQLLGNSSEEGSRKGLSFINMEVLKFKQKSLYERIPNIGWFYIDQVGKSKLFLNLDDPKFYFVHSYFFHLESRQYILGYNNFYGFNYTCAFEKDNILGVQFHPEKSHKFGMDILRNFENNY